MKGHDHNYYAVSKELNSKIWEFFRNTQLDSDANWQVYQKTPAKS